MCVYSTIHLLLRLFICSRIISFCFSKSEALKALTSVRECNSLICLIYVDFSSAALTGVMHVPPVPLVCLGGVVGELAGELPFFFKVNHN